MALGVLHDLAVGVDADGADAWALADVLATGVSIGAPPDNFTPRGQDWGLPPWRPDRLAATGYAALRDMLRAVLAHADGLRIDHVAGLWRLWWIPPGDGPDRGTYVYYDADTMLAVLALEAHRARATVVGEDLGTVEPEVTEALADNGMLGCAVSWFTRDQSAPANPCCPRSHGRRGRRPACPRMTCRPLRDYLRGEHVRARADLGLLDDVAAEQAEAERERAEWLALLRSEGLCLRGHHVRNGRRGGDHRRDAPAAGVDPEPTQAHLALRRRRRTTATQSAWHRRRIPELAAATADDPRAIAGRPASRRDHRRLPGTRCPLRFLRREGVSMHGSMSVGARRVTWTRRAVTGRASRRQDRARHLVGVSQ